MLLMKKAIVGVAVFLLTAFPAFAREVPEQAGDYPEPGRSDMRVRVFVYEQKPERPGTATVESAVCSDPHVNDVVGVTGWRLPTGTWTYRLNPASAPAGIRTSLGDVASLGFGEWEAYQSAVDFARGADTSVKRQALDFQNVIAWGKTPGNTLGVTYTRYYTATHEVADVDTIMNSRVKWSWNQCTTDSYDAQAILTHELGHWMGLDDEYTASYVDNTMFGYGDRAETKKDTLEAGDVAGVQVIY